MSNDTKTRKAEGLDLSRIREVSPKDFKIGDRIVLGEKRDKTPILSNGITEYEVNPRGCKGNVHVKCYEGKGNGCYAICAPWKVYR